MSNPPGGPEPPPEGTPEPSFTIIVIEPEPDYGTSFDDLEIPVLRRTDGTGYTSMKSSDFAHDEQKNNDDSPMAE